MLIVIRALIVRNRCRFGSDRRRSLRMVMMAAAMRMAVRDRLASYGLQVRVILQAVSRRVEAPDD